MSKFDDLSLYEQTQKVNALKQHFTSIGRPNISMEDILELSRADYDSGSSDLQMFQAGLVDIQTLVNAKQSKYTEPNPPLYTEPNLTEMCKQKAEQNRIDAGKQYQLLQSINNPLSPAESTPKYPNYY